MFTEDVMVHIFVFLGRECTVYSWFLPKHKQNFYVPNSECIQTFHKTNLKSDPKTKEKDFQQSLKCAWEH